ncbi:hypothetical protein DXG01_012026, partial [Tephrocybe rancida]
IRNDTPIPVDPRSPNGETVFFKGDALYQHNVLRINYTTYDVRRSQDVLNPHTDHRDIMLLRQPWIPDKHEYRYARILGVYHVNTIYHGPGQQQFQSTCLDFVWVRWFELADGNDIPVSAGWAEEKVGLDQLSFPPIKRRDAFGFLDPNDILRSCHIIPRFRSLEHNSDGKGLSGLAQDGKDWREYYAVSEYQGSYVNRFVDRDMLIRFHWGLGVGHMFTRGTQRPTDSVLSLSRSPNQRVPPEAVANSSMDEELMDDALQDSDDIDEFASSGSDSDPIDEPDNDFNEMYSNFDSGEASHL